MASACLVASTRTISTKALDGRRLAGGQRDKIDSVRRNSVHQENERKVAVGARTTEPTRN